MPLNEKQLANALEIARVQGLPHDWTLTLDDKGRKKWTSPGVRPRSFAYLQRALDHVNKQKGNIQDATVANNSTSKVKSKIKIGKSNGSKNIAGKKRESSSSRPATKKKNKKSSSSSVYPDPYADSDPETSLEVPHDFGDPGVCTTFSRSNRCTGTVHWDPNSPQGQKVGHRIRVWDSHDSFWQSGRIVRYDPVSHKHKVVFFHHQTNDVDKYKEEWLWLDRENVQLGGRFVWALVKGFAWWPAQILHCHYSNPQTMPSYRQGGAKDLTMHPIRDGYELVEFFGSDEVASVKNNPEFLRDFQRGKVDAVIRKNKKKRNLKAVENARQEEITTQEVRNDAARFYAEKAFQCVNRLGKADGLLGRKIEIFRSDINYPVGETLIGTIRLYSPGLKKHLVGYDLPPDNSQIYEPTWINLASQRYKILDRGAKDKGCIHNPSDDDLYPFLFGYRDVNDEEPVSSSTLSTLDTTGVGMKCRGCVGKCDPINEVVLKCSKCAGLHHPGCLDPPMSLRAAENFLKSDEGGEWTCNRCVRCFGCRDLEIAFGPQTVTTHPPSLFLPRNSTLQLCDSCIPMYEKESFCPICAHVWDDTRYQKIQSRLKRETKNSGTASDDTNAQQGKKRITASDSAESDYITKVSNFSVEENSADSSFRWKLSSSIDNSCFYPEKNVWGYNEGTMLICEQCNLWVHAGCAQLTREEYEDTSRGEHHIYSREFLCRSCCKEKCLSLMSKLVEEDTMYLFAAPVTDQVAHNYRDIIDNPMDLQTMSERAHIGNYRNYAWLRDTFELMVYNALLFNPAHSKYWNEAKRFYLACKKNVFAKHGKGAPPSKYKVMIKERFDLAEKMIQAEKDRVKADETTKKKDLVAGDQVLSVKLGPLVKPCDPPSCVPTTVVRMSPVDAFYSTWLECCFSCGSSGALDTMLFCVDCGEAYHSFCANAPIRSMNNAAVHGWRCPNCKLDEVTGEVTEDELKLLYCDMCDRAFSMDKLSPPLEKIPSGLWICGQCVDCAECNNVIDGGNVSRAFWSRNPSLCLPCGGCNGLEIESVEKGICRVCKKISRSIDGLPKCTTCDSYIHLECDSSDQVKGGEYSCPRCRKRAARALKRRLERAKAKELAKSAKAAAKLKLKTKPKPKRPAPPNSLTKEEQKEEALAIALKDAQSRGLPEGWTCFYGAANRKRWRSPPPVSRVFDSIPKALQYAEKVKNGLVENVKKSKRIKKEVPTEPDFEFFQLDLQREQDWLFREIGYDESTSLMSDAEGMLKLLDSKIGKDMSLLFDPEGKLFLASPHVQCLPEWLLSRAGRFVRFVKRLKSRSAKSKKRRSGMSNGSAQKVVCKMASAFLYSMCIMFKVDIKTYIKSWRMMQNLLIPVDEDTGTVDMTIDTSNKNDIYAKTEVHGTILPGFEEKEPMSTHASNRRTNHLLQPTSAPKSALVEQCSDVLQNQSTHLTLQHATLNNSRPQKSGAFEQQVVHAFGSPVQSIHSTIDYQRDQPYEYSRTNYSLEGKSENDLNIADALMTLASPPRAKPSNLPMDYNSPKHTDHKAISHGFIAPNSTRMTEKMSKQVRNIDSDKIKQNVECRTIERDMPEMNTAISLNKYISEYKEKETIITTHPNAATIKQVKGVNDVSLNLHLTNKCIASSVEIIPNGETSDTLPVEHQIGAKERKASLDVLNTQVYPPSPDAANKNEDSIVGESKSEMIAIAATSLDPSAVEMQGKSYTATSALFDGNDESSQTITPSTIALSSKRPTVKAATIIHKSQCVAESATHSKGFNFVETKDAVEKDVPPKKISGNSIEIASLIRNEATTGGGVPPPKGPTELRVVSPSKKVYLPWHSHQFDRINYMKGWESIGGDNSSELTWVDPRTCCLCHISGDDDAGIASSAADTETNNYDKIQGSGRLLPVPGGGWMHAGCAIWSSEVWENHIGGKLNGATKAKSRSTKLRCFGCGQTGATLGCHRSNCNANFHYPCAKACGVVFTSSHKLYCKAHAQYAKDEIIEQFPEPMKILRIVDDTVQTTPELCYRSGTLIVHSLGKIEQDRDGFHSKQYITPPGFSSTRIFWSFVKPRTRTVYVMRILRTPNNTAIFMATAADAPSSNFSGESAAKVFTEIMEKVSKANHMYFSHGDLTSVFPMVRSKKNKNGFCLNGPQFFGFGVNFIREALEQNVRAVACAIPLSNKSTPYQFCFQNPSEEAVTDLQRERAVVKAEKALENITGCARTEGDIDKSKGSGRITRDLVRRADEDHTTSSSKALSKGADTSKMDNRANFESIQAKYNEMKSVPMEVRLAARRSHIHGWGLFAKKDYDKNSMIAEYMGEAISQPIADKREKKYEVLGMGSCYMFRLDFHEIVDATQIGCMSRFMNHCCRANAYANVVSVNTDRGLEKKIVVFANQDIKNGDEITYDYKFPVEDGSLRCTCGAPNCIGRMN